MWGSVLRMSVICAFYISWSVGVGQYVAEADSGDRYTAIQEEGVLQVGLASNLFVDRTEYGPPGDRTYVRNSQALQVNRLGINPSAGFSIALSLFGQNEMQDNKKGGVGTETLIYRDQLAFAELELNGFLDNGFVIGAAFNFNYQNISTETDTDTSGFDRSSGGFRVQLGKFSTFGGAHVFSRVFWSSDYFKSDGEDVTISGANFLLDLHHFSTEKGRPRLWTDRHGKHSKFYKGQGFLNGGSGLKFRFLTQKGPHNGQLFGQNDNTRIIDWGMMVEAGLYVANGFAVTAGMDFQALATRRLNTGSSITIGQYIFSAGLQGNLSLLGLDAGFINAVGRIGARDELSITGLSVSQSDILEFRFGLGSDYFISEHVSIVPQAYYGFNAAEGDLERESSFGFMLSMRSYFH